MDEIKRLLPDEGVSAAASVLDDVANLPSQKRLYEARLRFQRYEAARARASEAAGEEVAGAADSFGDVLASFVGSADEAAVLDASSGPDV